MKILVIGDSCKDIFIYGKIERLSPEAPVPVIMPTFQKDNPGMAANVVANLEALGAEVDLYQPPSIDTEIIINGVFDVLNISKPTNRQDLKISNVAVKYKTFFESIK